MRQGGRAHGIAGSADHVARGFDCVRDDLNGFEARDEVTVRGFVLENHTHTCDRIQFAVNVVDESGVLIVGQE